MSEKFKKTVDEIYLTLEKDIQNLYPQKVYRCVRRYGLSSLPKEFVLAERKIKENPVERFNGKIRSKVFRRYILIDKDDLKKKLIEYLNHYNFEVRLKQIDYMTPADYLKKI